MATSQPGRLWKFCFISCSVFIKREQVPPRWGHMAMLGKRLRSRFCGVDDVLWGHPSSLCLLLVFCVSQAPVNTVHSEEFGSRTILGSCLFHSSPFPPSPLSCLPAWVGVPQMASQVPGFAMRTCLIQNRGRTQLHIEISQGRDMEGRVQERWASLSGLSNGAAMSANLPATLCDNKADLAQGSSPSLRARNCPVGQSCQH